jgi:phenylalanyl-tRNA synthetase alpha chain
MLPESVKSKIGSSLHNKKGHPIKIIKDIIYKYFVDFEKFDNLPCEVNVSDNFDFLLIPHDHPSRSKSDTYYIDNKTVLRTHTSAHQNQLLQDGHTKFLVTGDVYRKDEIDAKHYPVFHQMEGVCLVPDDVDPVDDLKKVLLGLTTYLFPGKECRFGNDYFPFTEPSFEIEVKFDNNWLEILGCGVIHTKILDRLNIKQKGWAFGLGLERFAMILFNILDIRLFWSTDDRFLNQFIEEKIVTYMPFSKVTPVTKDISFLIGESEINKSETNIDWIRINDFYELVREICGDSIESVSILDKFYHKKTDRYSMTFRLLIGAPDYKITDPAKVTEHANNCMNTIAASLKNMGYIIR